MLAIDAVMSDGSISTETAHSQSCTQPPSGLLTWWPGDGDAADIVGAHDGALVNGATFAPGKVGQAFSFDGLDDFVSVPDDPIWTLGDDPFTIDLWVNFDQLKGRDPFISHDESAGNFNKWIFWFDVLGHDKPPGPALRLHINIPTLST
ncbi:MAG: LamG domain-containing protein, partial [Dehalococcoidia bacterium]|nr:LamG domain-containing protein [Dehalococcoidia bacterium]